MRQSIRLQAGSIHATIFFRNVHINYRVTKQKEWGFWISIVTFICIVYIMVLVSYRVPCHVQLLIGLDEYHLTSSQRNFCHWSPIPMPKYHHRHHCGSYSESWNAGKNSGTMRKNYYYSRGKKKTPPIPTDPYRWVGCPRQFPKTCIAESHHLQQWLFLCSCCCCSCCCCCCCSQLVGFGSYYYWNSWLFNGWKTLCVFFYCCCLIVNYSL